VFTHAHPDQSGGATKAKGSLLCAKAHHYLNEAEWSFWTDPDYETNMPDPLHVFAGGAQCGLGG
jgi:glyoxylase-like metal-dependent hydrolase (beta-lactamase superfamily II)